MIDDVKILLALILIVSSLMSLYHVTMAALRKEEGRFGIAFLFSIASISCLGLIILLGGVK